MELSLEEEFLVIQSRLEKQEDDITFKKTMEIVNLPERRGSGLKKMITNKIDELEIDQRFYERQAELRSGIIKQLKNLKERVASNEN